LVIGLVGVQAARIKRYMAARLRAAWTSTSSIADRPRCVYAAR